MKVIRGRNVEELYALGIEYLLQEGETSKSRAGDVIVSPTPVTSVYERPRERVLFNERRDANPFFHLLEGCWMLSGRNDSQFLNFYIRDFGARFAESDWTIHDAYGHRWRAALGFDQLDEIVDKLRRDPSDRQCVLQMWDVTPAHYAYESRETKDPVILGSNDLVGNWRTRPCNTHVYFRVRKSFLKHYSTVGGVRQVDRVDPHFVLDATVCCRSNDVIWGAYGANAVHFSVLQEYVAGRVGVGVGHMYQISNNFHGYVDVIAKIQTPPSDSTTSWYEQTGYEARPIGTVWEEWDNDLRRFMSWTTQVNSLRDGHLIPDFAKSNFVPYINEWFAHTATPLVLSYATWRAGNRDDALALAGLIDDEDWRVACTSWLRRRKK